MVLLDSSCTGLAPTLAEKRVCTELTPRLQPLAIDVTETTESSSCPDPPLRGCYFSQYRAGFCHGIAQRFVLEFSTGSMESSISR